MSLLLQITIFLGASLVLVPLLKRFGIATVLGYLFTGILLGPSVFNIASDPDDIQELAEYGVVFLMFIIGLELRPQRLWEMRKPIFVLGSLQVGITGILLAILAFFALQQGIASSVVIGFALAFSSTAFVLQMLQEKQQLNSSYGQQSFSILLFQDIAAIPLIAIIPMLAGAESTHHGIAYFAAIMATFSGLFLFSRYLMRPFFRFVAKSGAHELITAVGLFIVSLNPTSVDVQSIIFGNILAIADSDILQVNIIIAVSLIVLCVIWKDLLAVFFDEVHARSVGLSPLRLKIIFFTLLSACTIAALQTVGAILVIAMVVTPGATAYILSDKFSHIILISIAIGSISSIIGAWLSYFLDGATGGVIVTLQTALFLLAFFFAPKYGYIATRLKIRKGAQ